MRVKRKFLIFSSVGLSGLFLCVLAWAAIAFRIPIMERYYLWKLEDYNEAVRFNAAYELGRLKSVRSIPRIIKLLEHSEHRIIVPFPIPGFQEFREFHTPETLFPFIFRELGANSIPALVDLSRTGRDYCRGVAIDSLGLIGKEAIDTVPVILEHLRDQNAMVRVSSAVSLGQIGFASNEVVLALTESLKDEERAVREVSEFALRQILKSN